MLQFGPGGEHGVQVFLVPFGGNHEVGQFGTLILGVDGFQRVHPLGGDGLVPVDLAHALLHVVQCTLEALPFLSLFDEDLFCWGDAHSSKEVESIRGSALRRLVFVIDHFLQYLCIRLVALRHDADLHMAALLELRGDAYLLVACLLDGLLDLVERCFIVEDIQVLASLLYFL